MDKPMHRLELNRETVRRLTDEEVEKAAGGQPPPIRPFTVYCDWETVPAAGCALHYTETCIFC